MRTGIIIFSMAYSFKQISKGALIIMGSFMGFAASGAVLLLTGQISTTNKQAKDSAEYGKQRVIASNIAFIVSQKLDKLIEAKGTDTTKFRYNYINNSNPGTIVGTLQETPISNPDVVAINILPPSSPSSDSVDINDAPGLIARLTHSNNSRRASIGRNNNIMTQAFRGASNTNSGGYLVKTLYVTVPDRTNKPAEARYALSILGYACDVGSSSEGSCAATSVIASSPLVVVKTRTCPVINGVQLEVATDPGTDFFNLNCACPAPQIIQADGSCLITCPAGRKLIGNTCVNCDPGTFATAGANICTPCTAGQYSSAGAGSCSACAAGTYSSAGASSCRSCTAGTYSSAGASSCSSCAAGTYSSAGASSCSSCAAGTYSSAGASSCSSCTAGTYSSTGASSCSSCAAGTYSSAGASSCSSCAAGTYSSVGASSCASCDSSCSTCSGTATNCTSCRSGRILSGSSCSCPAGQYSSSQSSICLNCHSSCATCSSYYTNCTSCRPGMTLSGSSCSCPTGKYFSTNSNTCEYCDPSCATCDSDATNCTSCRAGLNYSSYYGTCRCPQGQYFSGSRCEACDPSCAACSGTATNCTLCFPGYYVSYNKCVWVTPCPSNSSINGTGPATNVDGCICKNNDYYWDGSACTNPCPGGGSLRGQGDYIPNTSSCRCKNRNDYWDDASQRCLGCPYGTNYTACKH